MVTAQKWRRTPPLPHSNAPHAQLWFILPLKVLTRGADMNTVTILVETERFDDFVFEQGAIVE